MSVLARIRRALRVRSANAPHDPIGPERRAALLREQAARCEAFRLTLRERLAERRALDLDPVASLDAFRLHAAA